jgi:hypothetical protein
MYDKLIAFYLDYVNNYLTIGVMAEHNMISYEDCLALITMGKHYYEEGLEL